MPDTIFPCKLICAILFSDEEDLKTAKAKLRENYGTIDHETTAYSFDHTQYYNQEMGEGLKRCLVSFDNLVAPESLALCKRNTIKIEEEMSQDGKRKVNLDPGHIARGRLILASTKDFSHRIYLDLGIYAEVTLLFKKKKIEALPWSYPDLVHPNRHQELIKINKSYLEQIASIPQSTEA